LRILLRKSLLFALALAHLAAAAGYAGIEHHCLRQHHPPAAETACSCAEPKEAATSCLAPISADPESSPIPAASSADAGSSCCPAETASASPAPDNSGPALANPVCCELVSLYHHVEESAPPVFTGLVQAPAAPIALLHPASSSSTGSLRSIMVPHAADRLNLPLLI